MLIEKVMLQIIRRFSQKALNFKRLSSVFHSRGDWNKTIDRSASLDIRKPIGRDITCYYYSTKKMSKYTIVMVRHGESEWNQLNLFCGWYDAGLSEKGRFTFIYMYHLKSPDRVGFIFQGQKGRDRNLSFLRLFWGENQNFL